MRFFFLAAAYAALIAPSAFSADLTAEEIMARVASNQDRAVAERRNYVYEQKVKVVTRRTNGKLMREETSISEVVPTPGGTKKDLKSLNGTYLDKGSYIEFHNPNEPARDSLDGNLVDDFRRELTDDSSKDGVGKRLFPLTTAEQKDYSFALDKEAEVKGRPVYIISFRPRDKNEITWAGEAWIDKEEFEPVHVATKLSRRIPLLVRTVFGTDLPGLGFNVEYQRFDRGVWFPVSFGTEFRLRAVFFINRNITMALENSHFSKAKVDSSIQFAAPE